MLRSAMMSYDNAENVCGGCKSDAAMRRDAEIVEGAKQRRWIARVGLSWARYSGGSGDCCAFQTLRWGYHVIIGHCTDSCAGF
jgi:hypothetical protein